MITNRPAGLWMLPAHVSASRSTLAALQRDFARLRTLDHPHIARLLELGCNGQQYYVTGERLDGEPLRDVLTHLLPERLDVGEADDVVRAIGSALVYAHEHGVAHGDVRAENVLVTMDRRFVLTNFLARRVTKVTGRAPRASDDLRGLARLAAELYTGSTSLQALRGAVHGDVPAARLNAIRAVLEGPNRRPGTVADFLTAAGLTFAGRGAMARRAEKSERWAFWRLVLPVAGAVAIGSLIIATYQSGLGASAETLQVRGLDALRAVTARVASPPAEPTAPAPAPSTTAEPGATVAAAAASAAGPEPPPTTVLEPSAPVEHGAVPGPIPEPAEQSPPDPAPVTGPSARVLTTPPAATTPAREPGVVSLGVARVAAREDHLAVAIDIVRSGDTSQQATVGWWASSDTAHEDEDYVSVGRQLVTFPAGATAQRVLIPIVNDGVRESEEVFTVHLGKPRGGVAGSLMAARVTLHDDD